ncbi:hypothetical protein LLEC1_03516 [Akanthomyces lecanii]|uniref:Alanine dehydrogenase/pyridine nucleotide transhydrogenase N-terminal domain-containing protein n=1 Tax=Cordyceps confragosa TaxID=2714763 RepID=A0A179I5Q0_CORDF|nr:hypothetical protein LLEC1_03516 [Akanthomyces lecanii]
MAPVIHLRSETKPFERRSPLSPQTAKELIDAGYTLRVEESPDRIYKDDEFKSVGAEIIPAGSWTKAPLEHIILGLKELPTDGSPLPHSYIHFHHCFKKQDGWATELSRFAKGDGILYDLEFLVNEKGQRVAAFGWSAGYAGTALALLSWSHQLLHPGVAQPPVPAFDSAADLMAVVRSSIAEALPLNDDKYPRLMIIGALGRCGNGAAAACDAAGVPAESLVKWDLPETAKGGPFAEITGADILVNCVYLGAHRVPPFTTIETLSFDSPTVAPKAKLEGPELRIIAIDHLPTMIAREASDEYSGLLLPSLLELKDRQTAGVWTRAEKTFRDRVAELP